MLQSIISRPLKLLLHSTMYSFRMKHRRLMPVRDRSPRLINWLEESNANQIITQFCNSRALIYFSFRKRTYLSGHSPLRSKQIGLSSLTAVEGSSPNNVCGCRSVVDANVTRSLCAPGEAHSNWIVRGGVFVLAQVRLFNFLWGSRHT